MVGPKTNKIHRDRNHKTSVPQTCALQNEVKTEMKKQLAQEYPIVSVDVGAGA